MRCHRNAESRPQNKPAGAAETDSRTAKTNRRLADGRGARRPDGGCGGGEHAQYDRDRAGPHVAGFERASGPRAGRTQTRQGETTESFKVYGKRQTHTGYVRPGSGAPPDGKSAGAARLFAQARTHACARRWGAPVGSGAFRKLRRPSRCGSRARARLPRVADPGPLAAAGATRARRFRLYRPCWDPTHRLG